MATAGSTYLFNNAASQAHLQMMLLAEILDGHTDEVLAEIGAGDDAHWRCLELGPGAGSVAATLLEVFDAEHVVAIDKDPRHIAARAGLEIQAGDIVDAELGDSRYDLIHARLLFMHLPQREQVLTRAIAALKPGGLIVVSDWDCTHPDELLLTGGDELRDAFGSFQNALLTLGARLGMDAGWARRVPAVFAAAGLTDLGGLTYNRLWTGGQPGMQLHACNSRQLHRPLLDAGVSLPQLELLRDGMQDPQVLGYLYPMYTTVGRRPS